MSTKEKIKKVVDDADLTEQEHSFAYDILICFSKHNRRLFIANILISSALIITLIALLRG